MIRRFKKTTACLFMATAMLNTSLYPAAVMAAEVAAEEVMTEEAITEEDAAEEKTEEAAIDLMEEDETFVEETTTETIEVTVEENQASANVELAEEVSNEHVIVSPALPSTPESTPAPTYKIIAEGKVNSSILNIRAKKSTSAKRLTKLKKGKKVEIISTGAKWVQVKIGNIVGYTQGQYISTSYGNASNLYANAKSGTTTTTISIRKNGTTNSAKLKTLKKGTKIQVLTTGKTWVKIKSGDVIGYATGSNIKLSNGGTATKPEPSYSSKGASVVAYAKRFLGNRYVYGGSSLTNGTDCSGFTMSVYRHFGKSLPHSSYSQRFCGKAVHGLSNARPGDLICYSGHVALYMGNNTIIHASNPKDGIKITHGAAYRPIVAIRRIF